MSNTREERLVQASRDALRWFDSYRNGKGLNGMHDDVLIARRLSGLLQEYAEAEQQDAAFTDGVRRFELEARR